MTWTAPLSFVRDVRLARLVRRSQAGERDAFRELYRALYPAVMGFIRRRVRSSADAEDLTSQVFFRLLESLERVDADRPVFAYVLSIARNLVADAARRPVVLPEVDGAPVSGATALDALISAEAAVALRAAVARLPEPTQELLFLRYGEGLRYAEIARVVGTTEQTVRQRVSRTVRDLRRSVEPGVEVASEG